MPRPAAALDPPVRLLHRDDRLLILDKPAGLAVHAGPRGGASLEDWLPRLALGKRRLPQPAHRLDADTAGCLVLGRTKPALAALGALFAAGRVEKTYWAVVRGAPPGETGELAAPLAKRSTAKAGWWMVVDPAGQPAVTAWRRLGGTASLTWLELRPRTGRTHQLRVHCAHLGCPILGDPRYGPPGEAVPLHLLARAIALPLDPPVAATAPPPPHMQAALRACGWEAGA
ncbi:RluA family pseudouridine synthase [Roseicella sp. DB1501]|uniref:RluA family pseudouridine synthase n=1 Tax=Roseicella sp. DB1501 TaxID=2730925 RepID=UPI0014924506|nr:RNA pseudouridine synthase [Roseicella sp. DB1501]NOG72693.1 RNA pseudouridine synthase [Roseicella sp. DB1501]